MKVLLLTDADSFAGTERHMFDLACALRNGDFNKNHDIDVRIACPLPSSLATRCAEACIRVLEVPKRGLIDWNAVRILRRQLKSRRIEIIHAHNGRTALAAALAVFLARRGRLVTTQHFLTPNHTTQKGFTAWISLAAHRWVTKKTHTVIAISQAVYGAALERDQISPQKITVVTNGVPDISSTKSSIVVLKSAEVVRKELEVEDRFLILCAARLEKEKDVATLINAMKIVAQNDPEALCLIAGDGSLHEELQTQIESSGLSHNVRLLGFGDDVLSLMKACDIFVLPSVDEPFGLVLIEAMALGKPVVATRAGGPLEIVEDGKNGFLVTPSSASEFADVLLKLRHDKTVCSTMGIASREIYEKKFTAQRMAREIAAVYQKALK